MGKLFGVLILAAAASLAKASESWARFYGDNVQITDFKLTGSGEAIVLGELSCNEDNDCDPEDARLYYDEECDAWVAKLDRNGDILWQKCYEGGFTYSVLPVRDGGILVFGQIRDSPGVRGRILKLDAGGLVQWDKGYYVPAAENASLFTGAETGAGYIAIGEIEPENGPDKAWILGLDRDGKLLWHKTLTGFTAAAISPSRDGNFIIAGSAALAGEGEYEMWVLKLAPNGQSLWQRLYRVKGPEDLSGGSSDFVEVLDVQETVSGEYLLAGEISDLVPDESPEGDPDIRLRAWIAKLDREGHLMWRKVHGEEVRFSLIRKILPTSDGGVLALGAGGEEQPWAVWLAKLNAVGEIEWQRFYGEDSWGDVFLQLLEDGRLLLAGASFLNTRGDWLLELEADGSLPGCGLEVPAAVSFRDAVLSERTIAYDETPPAVTVLAEETEVEDRHVVSLSACPVSEAFRSCRQIQQAGESYGDGVYPIALQTSTGPELLGARCAMKEFGGGWMWIARHALGDPRPPSEFVSLRFGEYGSEFGSFSIWPQVDWSATDGVVGLTWTEGSEFKAGLLGKMTSAELQRILATNPSVDAWVR